jgi:hypothetical protein
MSYLINGQNVLNVSNNTVIISNATTGVLTQGNLVIGTRTSSSYALTVSGGLNMRGSLQAKSGSIKRII